ncbi:pentapeptide repeat-containing protein [Cellulosimicrobium arenosum]|uniref:Pentapeptide repeat-containing protein n=1 Tax=Cellulosimicrobium arenosum TaxID=2708133 RepID=A0A927J0E6_9MICO|nr:pentapeptide repeat-containing protein [Cellulosimicrobium arenosum]
MPDAPRTVPPSLDPVVLPDLTPGDAYDLETGADLEGFELVDLHLDAVDLEDSSLFGTRVVGLRADQADLRHASLAEVVLERLDVPVLRGVRGRWRDVEVRDSRLGSAELYESTWHGVHLVGCKLGFVNLRGADLHDVLFTDCTIDELDLVQARATRVAFVGTRVRRLDVQASTLEHVDLRGADLDEIAGVRSLAGATVGELQLARLAPLLADALGVTVQD